MSSLPEEIYQDILLRLSVELLLVCKPVCKNWYALISNPDFVKSHHDLTIQRNKPILMLRTFDRTEPFFILHSDSYDSSSVTEIESDSVEIDDDFGETENHEMDDDSDENESDSDEIESDSDETDSDSDVIDSYFAGIKDGSVTYGESAVVIEDFVEMDYPFRSLESVVEFLGSSNGLVCLWFRGNGYSTEFFCVWNPATKVYKKIQKSPNDSGVSYVFGYDFKASDYKLLNFVEDPESMDACLVEVYTSKSSSWRITQTIPYGLPITQEPVLINGILHWLGNRKVSVVILSLEMNGERFNHVQLPKQCFEKRHCPLMSLGVLEEKLCLTVNARQCIQVWVMQDYGVRKSWKKLYNITDTCFQSRVYAKFLRCLKNGEILFMILGVLVLYSPKHGSLRQLNIHGVVKKLFIDEMIYFESLVSLDSSTYVGRDDSVENEE